MKISQPLVLALCLLFTIGIGSLGAVFTAKEIPGWYAQLQKPSFNPPSWLFGPVWTLLYAMMGICLYLLWIQPGSAARTTALVVFFAQFTLNFFWSYIFFRLHAMGWALVEIIFMWLFILATIFFSWKIKTLAGWLLVPYLLWVSFASVLNGAIWLLNR